MKGWEPTIRGESTVHALGVDLKEISEQIYSLVLASYIILLLQKFPTSQKMVYQSEYIYEVGPNSKP